MADAASRSSPAGREVEPGTTLDALGFSSLERVELMVAIEEQFGTTIDEAAFAAAPNVAATSRSSSQHAAGRTTDEPRRARSTSRGGIAAGRPAALRRVSLPTWILPLARAFAWIKVEGLEHLKPRRPGRLRRPTTRATWTRRRSSGRCRRAGATASPWRWPRSSSRRTSSRSSTGGSAWFTNSLNYYLAALFFNAFPLPQREAGTRQTLRYIGDLFDRRLVGADLSRREARPTTGRVNPFRPRHRDDRARLDVPVVPVRLDGLDQVLHHTCANGDARPGAGRVWRAAPAEGRRLRGACQTGGRRGATVGIDEARRPARGNR